MKDFPGPGYILFPGLADDEFFAHFAGHCSIYAEFGYRIVFRYGVFSEIVNDSGIMKVSRPCCTCVAIAHDLFILPDINICANNNRHFYDIIESHQHRDSHLRHSAGSRFHLDIGMHIAA